MHQLAEQTPHTDLPQNTTPRVTPQRTRPRGTSGGLTRTDPRTDPRKRELQRQCHNRYVLEGQSYTAIARELKMDRETVTYYVRMESEARAIEREAGRAAEIDRSAATLNAVARHYADKMEQPGARGDEGRYIIQARVALNALLGLNAPIKVKDETPRAAPLLNISDAHVTALLTMAIEAKP